MHDNNYSQKMIYWFTRLEAAEAKCHKIAERYNGYVPPVVREELAEAELEYAFYQALAKDAEEE